MPYTKNFPGLFYDAGGAAYNVKHPNFGAVSDGSAGGGTDNTPMFQAAINALGGARGTIFVPDGTYRFLSSLDMKRARLVGSGRPENNQNGGANLIFAGTAGIYSSTPDTQGYSLEKLRIRGSAERTQNGQTLVDMTGQNYPSMWDVLIYGGENGLVLKSSAGVENHYGGFFNVSISRSYRGVYCQHDASTPSPPHTQKFFSGRLWDCVYGCVNESANDVAFFGTAFESDTPVWHPDLGLGLSPRTVLIGTRQESNVAPVIDAGHISDIGSYWSGYRRTPTFTVSGGEVQKWTPVYTAGIPGDVKPVQQNLFRNPGLVPDVANTTIPGWTKSGLSVVKAGHLTPFGRTAHLLGGATNGYIGQTVRLPAGRYSTGYGVQRDDTDASFPTLQLWVLVDGTLVHQFTPLAGGHRGGLAQREFTLTADATVEVRAYFQNVNARNIYFYAPFLVAGRVADRYSLSGEDARPVQERWGNGPPASGAWAVGDRVWNLTPTSTSPIGWVCTVAGSPGTWRRFGDIGAIAT